jgi:hypothetical protein
MKPAPSPKPCPKSEPDWPSKILAAQRYIFSVNALIVPPEKNQREAALLKVFISSEGKN